MRAVAFYGHGGPEVLREAELPVPEPRAGEVRVRVRAVALNHLDLFVRKGWPSLRLPMPHILGADVAGEVDAFGPDTAAPPRCAAGARVMLSPGVSCGVCAKCLAGRDHHCAHYGLLGEDRSGGYAEYIVVPVTNLLPLPARLSFEEAACLPVTFLTAWQMLAVRACVEAGETVLVQAAGSGVGIACVQIAKLRGATVLATASSEEKLAKARALGADHTINYATTDFTKTVRELTSGRGVDVVAEHVGGATFERSLRVLAHGGRIVTCGATSGPMAQVDLRFLFLRKYSLLGSTMGSKGDLATMLPLFESGRLVPVLDRTYRLEEAPLAHQRLADRAQCGKVVLIV
jgi:NADPH:quinone reductase-like Zn-dependent oxidoreductase